MSVEVRDGTGRTYVAKVTNANQVAVASDALAHTARACGDGLLFTVTTGAIALTTTASYSGLLYLLNTGTDPIYIWQITAYATVAARWRTTKQPTTGTLISGASVVTPTNANFADTRTLAATVYKGVDASTVTDGTQNFFWGTAAYSQTDPLIDTPYILGRSDSIAIGCRPSAAGDAHISIVAAQETLDF